MTIIITLTICYYFAEYTLLMAVTSSEINLLVYCRLMTITVTSCYLLIYLQIL